jgi:hypothetical protein
MIYGLRSRAPLMLVPDDVSESFAQAYARLKVHARFTIPRGDRDQPVLATGWISDRRVVIYKFQTALEAQCKVSINIQIRG